MLNGLYMALYVIHESTKCSRINPSLVLELGLFIFWVQMRGI